MWRTLGVNIRILFSAQQIQDTQNYHGHAIQPGGQAAGVWGYTCRELATMRCLRLNLGTCTCIFKLSNTHAPICLANMTVIGLMAAPKIQLKRLDMSHIGT